MIRVNLKPGQKIKMQRQAIYGNGRYVPAYKTTEKTIKKIEHKEKHSIVFFKEIKGCYMITENEKGLYIVGKKVRYIA